MGDDYEYGEGSGRQQRLGFWLLPFNKAAAALVSGHPWNLERYVFDKDTSGFWIDFSNPDKQEYTVGCSDSVDIYLPQVWNSTGSSGISELHASFRAVSEKGPILLCDESEYSSTEPFSHGSRSYTVNFRQDSSERSVLVAQGINSLVAFGHGRFYQFELRWENDGLNEFRMEPPVLYALGPSRVKTKRYVLGDKVGGGTFGNVYRALDVTTGSVMAVKKFHRLSGKGLDFASREITNLVKLNGDGSNRCKHIIQILSYIITPGGNTEIFLPLKAANVKTLITKIISPSSHFEISNLGLKQMLLALQHLEQHGIIHRDVNPENILFEVSPLTGTYHFTLTDFGLSTSTSALSNPPTPSAQKGRPEIAGTTPFIPPELFSRHLHKRPSSQTTKIDIWSLFATIVWIRDAKFRKGCDLLGPHLVHVWLNRIAGRGEGYRSIKRMACFDPARRPSAQEQLEILEVEAEIEELEELERLEELREIEEIERLEELDEMREMEARFAGLGLEWDPRGPFEGDFGTDGIDLKMQYYRREAYMKDAAGDYGWDGSTYDAWSGEGYVLPVEAPRDQEGWMMQDFGGHHGLVKSPAEEADAALAKWTAWYLAPEKEVVRKRLSVKFKEGS